MRVELPEPLVAKLSLNPDLYSLVLGSVDRFGTAFNHSGTPFFRSYTDHGLKHVSEVIETCVGLITPRAWGVFTAPDATVLVLATLLHDAALHLQEDGFIQLISGNHSWNGIAGLDTATWQELWDSYRAEASRFDRRKLRELFGTEEPVDPPDAKEPHTWTALQFEFVGEFVRRHHPRLAHEIAVFGMPGPNGNALRLLEADAAILDLAGLTARSHGIPLRACLPYLDAKYHRQEFQEIHAVFLMGVLRIADYLQIQADRAPKEILQIKALRSPLARREWNVHHAIRNITYNDPDPEAIRIQLDASKTDLETFLRLREWLNGIQAEIDTTWAVLGEVYGRYGERGLDQLSLIVRRIRSDLDDMSAFSKAVDYVPEVHRVRCRTAAVVATAFVRQSSDCRYSRDAAKCCRRCGGATRVRRTTS
jgi:molecular chaperone HtpG